MINLLSRIPKHSLLYTIPKYNVQQERGIFNNLASLWAWVDQVFNAVDKKRLKQVGPDRTCAEWLLRLGGSIKWKGVENFETDYNNLPKENFTDYKIEEIDLSFTKVKSIGFRHLEGLEYLKKMKIHECTVDDIALEYLDNVKDTLTFLQLTSCPEVTVEGLSLVSQLENLEVLKVSDLKNVKDIKKVLTIIQRDLPNCCILFKATAPKNSERVLVMK